MLITDLIAEFRDKGGTILIEDDGSLSITAQKKTEQLGRDLRKRESEVIAHLTGQAETPPELPWRSPDPFDVLNLDQFPTEALPRELREWVEAESHATQTPPDLAALLSLAVCGAGIARFVEVEPRPGWVEPVNLFVAILLEPGNRKSAVFSDAIKPLRQYESNLIELSKPDIAQRQSERRQDETRLRRMEKLSAEKGDAEARDEAARLSTALAQQVEPVMPRLIVDDATSEKLGIMLAQQDGRIASMSPEGGVFDLMAGMYSKSGSPQFGVYLMGHSGDDLVTDRVSRASIRVESPALTCAFAIQPAVIKGLASNAAFRGRGLLARFLYAAPRSRIGSRQIGANPVPPSVTEAYSNIVHRLASTDEHRTLRLTADADAKLREWETQIERMLADGGEMELMRDWGAKLAGATIRIAAILHVVEFGTATRISRETICAGIKIASYLIPHAEAVFEIMAGESGNEAGARYVLRWIKRHGRREFTKRDAQQHGKRRFPRAELIDSALESLMDRGFIRPKSLGLSVKPGRPGSPMFEVNPEVFAAESRTQNSQNGHSRDELASSENSENGSDRKQVTL